MKKVSIFDKSNSQLSRLLLNEILECALPFETEIYFDEIPKVQSHTFKVLVQMEPPAVLPHIYSPTNLAKFSLIITLSPWRAERIPNASWAFQPVDRPTQMYSVNLARNKALALINDHKFSSIHSARYSFRRKLIKKLETSDIEFDLFGPNWQMSRVLESRKRIAELRKCFRAREKLSTQEVFGELFLRYSSYRGISIDKYKTLSRYHFSLIVENDIDSLSEKLFDSFFSGAIPFYLGPKLNRYTDLEDLVIRLPDSVDGAFNVIRASMSKSWSAKSEAIMDFVHDENSMEEFSPKSVVRKIAEEITLKQG
jgi:hypothetical protein